MKLLQFLQNTNQSKEAAVEISVQILNSGLKTLNEKQGSNIVKHSFSFQFGQELQNGINLTEGPELSLRKIVT